MPRKTIASLEAKIEALEAYNGLLEAEKELFEADINALKINKRTDDDRLNSQKEEIDRLRVRVAEAEKERNEMCSELDRLKNVENENSHLKRELSDMETTIRMHFKLFP